MSGGIAQLVAVGAQDVHLVGKRSRLSLSPYQTIKSRWLFPV